MEITRETARRLMIEKQRFGPRRKPVKKEDILETVRALGCIQIDTINVIERAHYVTLWSRLGRYDKELLHQLAYEDRHLTEYWAHAASYIPLQDYRYFLHRMNTRRASMEDYVRRRAKTDPEILDQVLNRVKAEGPLAAKDFEYKRKEPSKGWWSWKPAKVALEALFAAGTLMISHRENFQRYYDLTERVLPPWVDTSEPSEEERIRFFALRTMGCLGPVKAPDIRKYYHHWSISLGRTSKQLQATLEELTEDDEAVELRVEGERHPHYCTPEDADRIQPLTKGDPTHEGVTLLTNFDNLLWNREKVESLFEFQPKLEVYLPAEQRKYGYYNLPILHGHSLVGRIVPKMDRKNKTLIVHSVWHEPRFEPDQAYQEAFEQTLEDFAAFNGAEKIRMEEKRPRIG
ncbi:winged helix-turn-helix domain-containing protein [Candidatus Bathyarchaeota archaeon]|nr:MAG: winged helix-turn-helix domain-containing protein [Candidatus Bathyarchaeota archaeon]